VIETSLLGQIRVVREFLPQMVKLNFGRIVFVSSTVAKEPSPMMVLSATARSGLSAFVKAISSEFAKFNITMNVICLGGVLTERLNSLIENSANQQKIDVSTVREKLVDSIPVGRFAEPKEIANMVTFLVSQEASYITGTSISIDGGLSKAFF
jgi:NAD(P)-dependent dehydrogenase (short-subunit alcohol dehydrogenase family)